MKSLRTTILCIIFFCLTLSSGNIALVAYKISKKELTKSVTANILSTKETVVAQLQSINVREFKILEGLSYLDEIRSDTNTMEEKCTILRSVIASNPIYDNVTFYDLNGNSVNHLGTVTNSSARDFFKYPMQGKPYIMNPFSNAVTGEISIIYSLPVRNKQNEIIGAIVSVLKGDEVCSIVNEITVGKDSHPIVISMVNSQIVGDVDKQRVLSQEKLFDTVQEEYKTLLEEACTGVEGWGSYVDSVTKKEMLVNYMPVGGNCNWTVVITVPSDDFYSGLKTIFNFIIRVFILSILLVFVLSVIIINKSLKPLKRVKKAINEVATGNADLTNRIELTTKDEIGEVVKGFNLFTEKMQSIVIDIKKSGGLLDDAGKSLALVSNDTSTSITQILANIQSVSGQITNQTTGVEETVKSVNEIATKVSSLEVMIENQVSGVTQASAAVEEMIGNISAVNQSVEKMANSFGDLLKNTQFGSAKQEDVNERIKQIETQSQMLQEANSVIAGIAAQTNLLAMNAAIEAAHAGDAGRGFSVVADEIRKLSETSTSQSKTIGDQLKKIEDSIIGVVSASAESSTAFSAVAEQIDITDELVQQIRSAMEEQDEGSKQIGDVLNSMNDSTQEVKIASSEMATGSKAILDEVKQLQNSTFEMRNSIKEMTEGANNINKTGVKLTEITTNVKSAISQISDQIGQFKV